MLLSVRKSRGDLPWLARARLNGKDTKLGFFHTEEEAHEAYKVAIEDRDKDKKRCSEYRGKVKYKHAPPHIEEPFFLRDDHWKS